jgi:hypothetical protein
VAKRVAGLGRPLLLALGVLLGAVLSELLLRGAAYLDYRGALSPERALPPDPPPGSRVRLGQLIRRSSDPHLVYELRPGLRVYYEQALVTTSASGFRGAEHVPEKPRGTFRILGIGDSFMFGQGVDDDETHLHLLERRLAADGAAAEVLNLAVPGYNTAMEVHALAEKGLRFSPDLVLVEFLGNDLDLPNFIRADPEVLSPRKWFLGRFVRARLGPHRPQHGPVDDPELVESPHQAADHGLFERDPSLVPGPYQGLVGWSAVERAFRRLGGMASDRGFRVVLLHWQSSPAEGRLLALARRLGIPALNLGQAADRHASAHGYAAWEDSPLVLGRGDNHPSALGHAVTSAAVHEFLTRHALVPGRGPFVRSP